MGFTGLVSVASGGSNPWFTWQPSETAAKLDLKSITSKPFSACPILRIYYVLIYFILFFAWIYLVINNNSDSDLLESEKRSQSQAARIY